MKGRHEICLKSIPWKNTRPKPVQPNTSVSAEQPIAAYIDKTQKNFTR